MNRAERKDDLSVSGLSEKYFEQSNLRQLITCYGWRITIMFIIQELNALKQPV